MDPPTGTSILNVYLHKLTTTVELEFTKVLFTRNMISTLERHVNSDEVSIFFKMILNLP